MNKTQQIAKELKRVLQLKDELIQAYEDWNVASNNFNNADGDDYITVSIKNLEALEAKIHAILKELKKYE